MKKLILLLLLIATPATAATLIRGSQIDRSWSLLGGLGLGINVTTHHATLDIGGSMSGRTLTLSDLRSCNLDTDSNGVITCGTDATGGGTGFNSGQVMQIGDTRYVRTAGGTMTGALKVRANLSGSSLNVDNLRNCDTINTDSAGAMTCGTDANTSYTAGQGLTLTSTSFKANATLTGTSVLFQTVSGSLVRANTLASSGTLVFEGAASGSSLYLGTSLNGAGLTSCTGGNKLLWSSGRFSCAADVDTNTTYTAGQGLTLSNTSFQLTAFHSGTTIWATTAIRSSGALTWEGTGSGASLYVADDFEGAGLTDCDADNQSLSWDATSKRFVCGDDDTGGAGTPEVGTNSFTGGVLRLGDTKYVKKQGDTMTGSLTITGASLFIRNGANVDLAQFTTWGNAGKHGGELALWFDSGASLFYASRLGRGGYINIYNAHGVGIVDAGTDNTGEGDGYVSTLYGSGSLSTYFDETGIKVYDSHETQYFTVLTSTQRVGIGTTAPTTKLDVVGTISGSTLTLSGLRNCNLDTDANGVLTCGTDATGGGSGFNSGQVITIGDTRYLRTIGGTLTGALIVQNGNTHSPTATALLQIRGTMSGYTLRTSSGALIDGGTLYASATNNRVGINNLLPKTTLEVIGAISGSSLTISGNASITGALLVKGNLTVRATLSGANILETDTLYTSMRALGSSMKGYAIGVAGVPTQAVSLVDGTARFHAVYVPKATTLTGVKFFGQTAGNYTADNNNYIALYSYSAGTLTQVAITANNGNLWKLGNQWVTATFSTPYNAPGGIYFIGMLYNSSAQTTAPQVGGVSGLAANGSIFDFTNSAKLASTLAAQTALPTPQSMAGLTATANLVNIILY